MEQSRGVEFSKRYAGVLPQPGGLCAPKYSLADQITGPSGSVFSDDQSIVQGMLIKLQEEWATYRSTVLCLLSFTEEDKKKQKEDLTESVYTEDGMGG
ncbi:Aminoglycoside phosphotransferase [Penicillium fimorum]|uniref:Aminoglycoside phosphotransferase n=1 Tax=Penicillium fimorum TaxID=1882269 RepID=A0A9W9XXM3_9EURO|nr:Aminoglycoside phosphotransferase [Penicillium fimorum]